jgi:hypothetical protein
MMPDFSLTSFGMLAVGVVVDAERELKAFDERTR